MHSKPNGKDSFEDELFLEKAIVISPENENYKCHLLTLFRLRTCSMKSFITIDKIKLFKVFTCITAQIDVVLDSGNIVLAQKMHLRRHNQKLQ